MTEEEKYQLCLEDLGKLLQKTSRIFQLMEREQVRRSQHTTSQSYLLMELLHAHNEELSMQQVIDKMKLEKSTITRLVDTLIKQGLVVRQKKDIDKRIVTICLSQAGKMIAEQVYSGRLNYYRNIISHLPRGHVREVMNSFEVLLNAL
ncbi:MAG: MarR family transcriptional regulator, partial [Spirochaetes bacterium]|nr:MarR family transcriptional regulator [Spirochaetota bacterium]